jgi:hypothetical protein
VKGEFSARRLREAFPRPGSKLEASQRERERQHAEEMRQKVDVAVRTPLRVFVGRGRRAESETSLERDGMEQSVINPLDAEA